MRFKEAIESERRGQRESVGLVNKEEEKISGDGLKCELLITSLKIK